jgi:hypothetical protein
MGKRATVTVTLEYIEDELRFILGDDFPTENFDLVVEEQVYQDLRNCLMSEPIKNFATIQIEDC